MANRMLFWLLVLAGVLSTSHRAEAEEKAKEKEAPYRSYAAVADRGNTCVFGVLAWCFAEEKAPSGLANSTPIEVDLFSAYKFSSMYYKEEVENCESIGCTVNQKGFSNGISLSYRHTGNGREDRDNGFGLAVSTMPVVTALENNTGFEGSMGPVSAGDGPMTYTNIRLILRRRHFFYLLRSRYFIGTFGAGLAIPVVTQDAGKSFTGSRGVQPTIGGRMGIQIPISDRVEIGLVDHWGVWWYGRSFTQSAFLSSYGLHLSARI